MKSIEERADAYVGHPEEIDEFTSATIKRDAYIRGAKEQKAIDDEDEKKILTERAWRYLVSRLRPAALGTDGLVVLEGGINEEEFRKLMMEE